MEKSKPKFMGKCLPKDDKDKLTDFVMNKYESFSKCYDACKDKAKDIKDVSAVNNEKDNKTFTMKVSTNEKTMKEIKENNKDEKVSVQADTITATC